MANSKTVNRPPAQESRILWVIGVLSVAIPLVVAVLLFIPQTGKLGDLDVSFLPHLNATLNSATALCLIGALLAIRKGSAAGGEMLAQPRVRWHRMLMLTAFTLSSIFLVSYVIYHYQGPKIYYGDANHDLVVDAAEAAAVGSWRYIYLVVLISHILFSIAVVPLVLLSLYFAFTQQWRRHVRLTRWAHPIWLYVAVTGVLVYFMIRPFYY